MYTTNQAVVMVKNACGESARKYLKEIKWDLKINIAYLFSFTPKCVIRILRFLYKKLRILWMRLMAPNEFRQVEKWMKKCIRVSSTFYTQYNRG